MTSLDLPQSEEAELSQAETNAGVARATSVLALGNVASRVLGMAREVALTTLFGASRAVDAFYVATIIPKTIYDLLIAGHVNSAIIPVFSEIVAREGREALWRLVSVLISLVSALLALLVLGLTAFAPQIVALVGSGYDAATLELASALLRITAPALLFLGLFSVLSGALFALRVFTWPAFAGAVFNACVVLITVLLTPPPQVMVTVSDGAAVWSAARPLWGIQSAAVGWLAGSLVQFLLQLPGLRGARMRLTLNWRHPAIPRIARLYAPVMASLILDTLVVRTFSYNLASQTIEGALGYMNWATTLIQFPQGLVATAISIAILPTLARHAALINPRKGPQLSAKTGRATPDANPSLISVNERAFRDTLGLGLRLTTTLILPAAVGLFVLATPIVVLLFERGAFTPADTVITVTALRLYLFGLPFAALDLLLVYAFYARQDTLTPALIGLFSLVIYMIVALVLLPAYGLFSLMIADSVKHIVHAVISALLLNRRMGGFGHQRLLPTAGKTMLAAGLMGTVAFALQAPLSSLLGPRGFVSELLLVLIAGVLSAAVFLILAVILRIEEPRWLWGLLYARLRVKPETRSES
ncbi:MAG: murein biosynthesis integral membrane protein MurJ [Aggregatilineales bacterium]